MSTTALHDRTSLKPSQCFPVQSHHNHFFITIIATIVCTILQTESSTSHMYSSKAPTSEMQSTQKNWLPPLWPLVSSSIRGMGGKKGSYHFHGVKEMLSPYMKSVHKTILCFVLLQCYFAWATGDLASKSQKWSWKDGWEFEHLLLLQKFGSQHPNGLSNSSSGDLTTTSSGLCGLLHLCGTHKLTQATHTYT